MVDRVGLNEFWHVRHRLDNRTCPAAVHPVLSPSIEITPGPATTRYATLQCRSCGYVGSHRLRRPSSLATERKHDCTKTVHKFVQKRHVLTAFSGQVERLVRQATPLLALSVGPCLLAPLLAVSFAPYTKENTHDTVAGVRVVANHRV